MMFEYPIEGLKEVRFEDVPGMREFVDMLEKICRPVFEGAEAAGFDVGRASEQDRMLVRDALVSLLFACVPIHHPLQQEVPTELLSDPYQDAEMDCHGSTVEELYSQVFAEAEAAGFRADHVSAVPFVVFIEAIWSMLYASQGLHHPLQDFARERYSIQYH